MTLVRARVALGAICACAVLAAVHTWAADDVLPIPAGWKPSEYVFTAASGRLGFVLYRETGDPFESGSRLLLVESGNTHFKDIEGKVYALAYAPDGSTALVHSESAFGPKVTLVRADGTIVWTRSDTRRFAFNANGTRIYAWQPASEWARPGNDVEVLTLQGTSVSRFTFDGPFVDVMISDSGTDVLVLTPQSLVRYGAEPTMHQICSFPLPTDNEGTELQALGTDRVIIPMGLGRFRVLRTLDCGSVYAFDPTERHAANPARSRADYASFRPYPISPPNRLLLFRYTNDGLLLDLETGALTSRSLDIAAPAGAKQMPRLADGRMAFWSLKEIRVRRIALTP